MPSNTNMRTREAVTRPGHHRSDSRIRQEGASNDEQANQTSNQPWKEAGKIKFRHVPDPSHRMLRRLRDTLRSVDHPEKTDGQAKNTAMQIG